MVRQDGRVRLLRSPHVGAAAARNLGLTHSDTEWVVFLDADDTLDSRYLHHMQVIARRKPWADVICCSYCRVDQQGALVTEVGVRRDEDVETLIRRGTPPCIHAFMCRRRCLVEAGAFDESLRTNEDWDLWLRLVAAGTRFAVAPQGRAYYWQSRGSLTKNARQVLDDRLRVSASHRLPTDVWATVFWLAGVTVASGADARMLVGRLPSSSQCNVRQLGESWCEGASVVTDGGERGLVDAWPKFVWLKAFAEAVEKSHAKLSASTIIDHIEWAAARRSEFVATRALSRSTAVWCDWRQFSVAATLPRSEALIVRVPFVKPRSWFTVRARLGEREPRRQLARQLITGVSNHLTHALSTSIKRGLRAQ